MNSRDRATPKGFLFSTTEAAIKKPGRKDLALIFSEREALMSGMFTRNKVKAAPVQLDMKRIASGKGQAIIVNSGNANACTGKQGKEDALIMTGLVAGALGLKEKSVYVCSTGVIGQPLPMNRIVPKINGLVKSLGTSTLDDVAAAIMTTDSFPKVVSRGIKIGKRKGTIAGICKGAGMICPNMATMLSFIITDINISGRALERAFRDAVKGSFNRITVDGDMSTNDTVLVMANGLAENDLVEERSPSFGLFLKCLSEITGALSRMIVKDGEGATKLVEVTVKNAATRGDAEKGAYAIANSLLVKTAMYGNDGNWGRIIAALGYSGIKMKEEKTDIYVGRVKITHKGLSTGSDREAAVVLQSKEVSLTVDLHLGSSAATVVTCDLTEDYIKINAGYRS